MKCILNFSVQQDDLFIYFCGGFLFTAFGVKKRIRYDWDELNATCLYHLWCFPVLVATCSLMTAGKHYKCFLRLPSECEFSAAVWCFLSLQPFWQREQQPVELPRPLSIAWVVVRASILHTFIGKWPELLLRACQSIIRGFSINRILALNI